jgi:hypothetical protein
VQTADATQAAINEKNNATASTQQSTRRPTKGRRRFKFQIAQRKGHSAVVATLEAASAALQGDRQLSSQLTSTMLATDFRSVSNRELTLPIGCFVVRPSSKDCCLALSLEPNCVGAAAQSTIAALRHRVILGN